MKITNTTEYLNEVHNKWLPVPPHWIGLDSSEVSHKLYFTVTTPAECDSVPSNNWRVECAGLQWEAFTDCSHAIARCTELRAQGLPAWVRDVFHGWLMWPAKDYRAAGTETAEQVDTQLCEHSAFIAATI